MPESTHDLIAAKAARLRELLRLAEADEADDGRGTTAPRDDVAETPHSPTWSGGGWNN